jgi:uncharacterized membrane protein YdjX (TVP38/TMEM64 family)
MTQTTAGTTRARRLLPRVALGLAVAGALLVLGSRLGGYLPGLVARVEALGPWAPAAFVAGYAVAVVAFVPASLLTLAAGAVFGVARGTLLVAAGATLGASAAFLLARYAARDAVARRLADRPRFAALDRAVGAEGRKLVFLLRLSPVFPFGLLNYALGLTRVRFVDYLIASVGMLPGTLLYVYSGKVAGDVATLAAGAAPARGTAHYVVLGLGLVATALVTMRVTRLARRALADAEASGGPAPGRPVPGTAPDPA